TACPGGVRRWSVGFEAIASYECGGGLEGMAGHMVLLSPPPLCRQVTIGGHHAFSGGPHRSRTCFGSVLPYPNRDGLFFQRGACDVTAALQRMPSSVRRDAVNGLAIRFQDLVCFLQPRRVRNGENIGWVGVSPLLDTRKCLTQALDFVDRLLQHLRV